MNIKDLENICSDHGMYTKAYDCTIDIVDRHNNIIDTIELVTHDKNPLIKTMEHKEIRLSHWLGY